MNNRFSSINQKSLQKRLIRYSEKYTNERTIEDLSELLELATSFIPTLILFLLGV
jgi:hypothetical protein